MTSSTIVIYHAGCWDGFAAAWCARRFLGEHGVEFVPAKYGDAPPDVTDKGVYVLDFSYPRNVLEEMANKAMYVYVLDHHATAAEALSGGYEVPVRICLRDYRLIHPRLIVKFDNNKSGARLAWEHFQVPGREDIPISPWLVDYVEDRDLWRHKLEFTKEVNAALRSYPLDFDTWDVLALHSHGDYFNEGKAILRHEEQWIENHVKNAKEVEIAGFKVLAVNATVLMSEIGNKLAQGRPFGATWFETPEGKKVWSLRSTDDGEDVSKIAKMFGGGGHVHAAGYSVTEK
jgi:oligoribonuclease NrnB/cAMP/cGMP phosphodiesterase (DHH superfamily)